MRWERYWSWRDRVAGIVGLAGALAAMSAAGFRVPAEPPKSPAADTAPAVAAGTLPSTLRLLKIDAAKVDEGGKPVLTWTDLADVADALPARVVVLVHGLDEPGGIFDELAPRLSEAGYATVRFDYPNDQPIAASASEFGPALVTLRARGVQSVDLICHSMGAIIARDVLTRPATGKDGSPVAHWYAGNAKGGNTLPAVERFVMIGAPNHGSRLAHVEVIGEVREQLQRFFEATRENPTWPGRYKEDGRGEAATDLLPGSAYLTDLNSRPLPTGVAITNILGRMTPAESRKWIESIEGSKVEAVMGKEAAERAAGLLREAVAGVGDGVVTRESAMLDGIPDTVEVEGNHRTILNRWAVSDWLRRVFRRDAKEAPAIPVILDRLAK